MTDYETCEMCHGKGWYPDFERWSKSIIEVRCPRCGGTGLVTVRPR